SPDAAPPLPVSRHEAVDQSATIETINTSKLQTTEVPNERHLTVYPNDEFTPSFSQLMTKPDRYHGKKIRLRGFLHVEFEGNAIYLSKEHADHLIAKEGFWVTFDKTAVPFEGIVGPKEFHRRWVLVEGTFNKDGRGHHSAWSGEIANIDRVSLLTNYHDD
ncbi:MAG TPA: hypothetical protein VL096_15825, partial [Pirellulaceae bacterium]|nr:hypothetical protein [Pirellulaceae bacterium]